MFHVEHNLGMVFQMFHVEHFFKRVLQLMNTKIYEEVMYRRDFSGCVFGHYTVGLANRAGTRSEVSELSRRSVWRMVTYLKSSVATYRNLTTLTYPADFPTDGPTSKRHLDKFLQQFMRKNSSACWFLEFQKRGAPHYHILHTDDVPHWEVASMWAIANGEFHAIKTMTRIERLRKARGGVISYAVKYAGKSSQKEVPEGFGKVGRFWGVRGDRRVYSACTKLKVKAGGEALEEAIYQVLHDGVSSGEITMNAWANGVGVFCQPKERLTPWWSTNVQKKIETILCKYGVKVGSEMTTTGLIPDLITIKKWSEVQ